MTGRRSFLRTVAAATGAAQTAPVQAPVSTAKPAAQAVSPAAPAVNYPRTFTGRQLSMIAFPIGGVGAGCISLGGRGQLRDWEIFNKADKGRAPAYAFAAIWAQAGSRPPVARVLEARQLPPYQAASGLSPDRVAGLPRLESATFTGEFPLARIDFRDSKLPVRVSLEAFSPFVPHEEDESGLPVAIFRYRVRNPSKDTVKVSIVFSLDNPVHPQSAPPALRRPASQGVNEFRTSGPLQGILMTNPALPATDPAAGSFALCTRGAGSDHITYLRGWQRARWWTSPLLFWDDFTADGALGPEPEMRNTVASLCVSKAIPPGGEAPFEFLLAWHFPNRTPRVCGWSAPKGEEDTLIGNYYATRFASAWAAAEHASQNLDALEKRMRLFVDAIRTSTLPPAVKDAATANLSTLVSPTCFRTADGKFRGFEGVNDQSGCCFGNCTHVWNYESATQYLFPALARSMREAAFDLADSLNGLMPIRLQLPEGKQKSGVAAADGTMGQIMKAYLDWQLTGDNAWLQRMWPKVKKAIEFCWKPGGWDADRDGVMEGVQHNTYDVEFYGPNPMCGIYYLGALRACEEMARGVGDYAAAGECRRLFEQGSKWIDENLFNGEYYVQRITPIPKDNIADGLRSPMGADDPERPEFQLGEGCLADQLVGQYVADYAGLGNLVARQHIRKALESIHKYNYKRTLFEHESVQRTYALNDEAGLVICSYAKAQRPRSPFPYFAEVWASFEYLVAAQFIRAGMVRQAFELVEGARRRFDGEKRNPWDETECGHHYARNMAAWSVILALSGFHYEGSRRALIAVPALQSPRFRCFWSTGTAWGVFERTSARFSLRVLHGKLQVRTVEIAGAAGGTTTAEIGGAALPHEVRRTLGRAVFTFPEPLELAAGVELVLTV